jgi:hypothetical protein
MKKVYDYIKITKMKKLLPLVFIVIVFYGCSKNNPASTLSHWTFYENSFTVNDTANNTVLVDSSLNSDLGRENSELTIKFGEIPTSGAYTVVRPSGTLTSQECSMTLVFSVLTPGEMIESSLGGGTVTVTNSGSKIAASFSKINMVSMYDSTTSNGYVSGTLIQK